MPEQAQPISISAVVVGDVVNVYGVDRRGHLWVCFHTRQDTSLGEVSPWEPLHSDATRGITRPVEAS